MPPCQPQTSTPIHENTAKTMKLPDPPEYVVYTDSELDMVRSQYFALLRNGNVMDCKMSKELTCRLIRNTITSMVAILRASPLGKEVTYPSKHELRAMSQKIVDYYPMLRDATDLPYVSFYFFKPKKGGGANNKTNNLLNIPLQLTIYSKMYKRLQNMKSPRKRQGPVPQRGVAKKSLFRTDTEDKTDGETSSSVSNTSTVMLASNDDLSDDNLTPGMCLKWEDESVPL